LSAAPLSVRGLLSGLASLLEVEEEASRTGPLHKIDPLIRNISLILITVSSLLTRSVVTISFLCLLLIVLVVFSRVSPGNFFLKTSILPLFTLIIVLPIPFLTPGSPVWTAGLGPFSLSVSYEGLLRVTEFVLRVWLCVGVAVLITNIGGMNGLVSFLRSIRLPGIFVQTLSLAYRYIFLSINESTRMLLARDARTFRKRRRLTLEELKGLSGVVASLLVRTYDRSERVYLAMRARGFSLASARYTYRWSPRLSDISFITMIATLLLIILSI